MQRPQVPPVGGRVLDPDDVRHDLDDDRLEHKLQLRLPVPRKQKNRHEPHHRRLPLLDERVARRGQPERKRREPHDVVGEVEDRPTVARQPQRRDRAHVVADLRRDLRVGRTEDPRETDTERDRRREQ